MPQVRFIIVCGFAQFMEEKNIGLIMEARVILHNIIVKDEQDKYMLAFDYNRVEATNPWPSIRHECYSCCETYFQTMVEVYNPKTHACLQVTLVEEI